MPCWSFVFYWWRFPFWSSEEHWILPDASGTPRMSLQQLSTALDDFLGRRNPRVSWRHFKQKQHLKAMGREKERVLHGMFCMFQVSRCQLFFHGVFGGCYRCQTGATISCFGSRHQQDPTYSRFERLKARLSELWPKTWATDQKKKNGQLSVGSVARCPRNFLKVVSKTWWCFVHVTLLTHVHVGMRFQASNSTNAETTQVPVQLLQLLPSAERPQIASERMLVLKVTGATVIA